jgi:hypothetical protein
MSAELVRAIDDALAFASAHPDEMTRAEVDCFCELAERVYLLAYPLDLDRAFPHVPELQPELEFQDPPLPPVQFVSKLHLPGDWDIVSPADEGPLLLPSWQEDPAPVPERTFLPCATKRWHHDMRALRKLADARGTSEAEGSGESSKQPADSPTIWHQGGRSYFIDGRDPVTVTLEEDNILTVFAKRDEARDTKRLADESGVTNVSRVMGHLAKKFGDAVRTPGRKGKGDGYYARVRPAPRV